MWSGLSAISATLKRNVKLYYKGFEIFPNMYVVLVGPPGIGKGLSISPVVDLATKANVVNYLSDRITAEKILERLANGFQRASISTSPTGVTSLMSTEHTATIVSRELPVFLSSSEWMPSLLCELWDRNSFDYQTKNKGSMFIKDMCVGLLAACVPDYIRKLTKDSNAPVTSGFTARSIFVYANRKSKSLDTTDAVWLQPNGYKSNLHDNLVEDLKDIAQANGDFQLTHEAKLLWKATYSGYGLVQEDYEIEALANFKSRVPSHVLKTAMALSISDSNDLVITMSHLQTAIKMVEDIRDNVNITFRAVGESPIAASLGRVMDFIEKRGAATYKEILKFNKQHVTEEQLKTVLMTLETIDFCTSRHVGNSIMYSHNPNYVDTVKGKMTNAASVVSP